MPQEEILDLVNDNDEVIGAMERNEVYAKDLHNFRVVNAFVINEEGKLWIPRRGMHKRIAPGALDMSMGGHVESGETYDQSAAREIQEELNINIAHVPFECVAKLTPHEHGVNAFQQIYLIHSNETPHYNPDDFTESFWLTPTELLAWIEKGEPCKSDLPMIVRHLLAQGILK